MLRQVLTSQHLFNISGVYAVTPNELDTKLLVSKVVAALEGGIGLLQYRNKAAGKTLRLRQSTALLAACRAYDVPLVINDHIDLCAQIDADGVHLGAADCMPGPVRRLLGADKIIGVSCYNQLAMAKKAAESGADYITFGACFSSEAKADDRYAPLGLCVQAKEVLDIPVVASGGITLDNAKLAKEAGADAIAVISGLFDVDNINQVTKQFHSIFK